MVLFEKVLDIFNLKLSINRKRPKTITKFEREEKNFNDIFSSIGMSGNQIVDLEKLSSCAQEIPGMTDSKAGQFLFTMCYLQQEEGDVVEIGSWQGRSTSYLARAVQSSGNGKMYAIDPFTGNVGKESYYVVNKNDLSDLKDNFLNNIKMLGLADVVELLPMTSDKASLILADKKVRYLFIDGDHSEEGVTKDLECFFPLIRPGGIIVFDDFLQNATGLISAVNRHMQKNKPKKAFTFKKTLVIQY